MNDYHNFLDQQYALHTEDDYTSIREDLVYLSADEMVQAINMRPENYLGVNNIHAPFPGVSPEMLDSPKLLAQYIDGFTELKEWREFHRFVLDRPDILAATQEKMRNYVQSEAFMHDLATIIAMREQDIEPILVGGNMVERVIPLAYLFGLPVYQAPPVEGDWRELDTQLRELDRNLDTIHHLVQVSPKTIGFVWIGMDLSRESQRLAHQSDEDFLPVRFAGKEVQMIQKLTEESTYPVHFEPLITLPKTANPNQVTQGVAGYDYIPPTVMEDLPPENVIDFKILQQHLQFRLTSHDVAYLYSTGHWHHINTEQIENPVQQMLLESIKEALVIFRNQQGYDTRDLVESAKRARRLT